MLAALDDQLLGESRGRERARAVGLRQRRNSEIEAHGVTGRSTSSVSPACAAAPATPWIECTVPALPAPSASTAFSIFMAPMITSFPPWATPCPAATFICHTLPDTGEVMAM